MDTRASVLRHLAGLIVSRDPGHPLRVAIDGADGAGKTTLADELALLVEERGRPAIRASIDGFHRPRKRRYARGRDSGEGYYLDSFDHDALQRLLLDPLGPGGDRRYRAVAFDYHHDAALEIAEQLAPANAVLLFDGVFLLRPELADAWDLKILVEIDPLVALERALARDGEGARELYARRYRPGQDLYRRTARPADVADIVLDNTNLSTPSIVRLDP